MIIVAGWGMIKVVPSRGMCSDKHEKTGQMQGGLQYRWVCCNTSAGTVTMTGAGDTH
jgi:hypothetical protein